MALEAAVWVVVATVRASALAEAVVMGPTSVREVGMLALAWAAVLAAMPAATVSAVGIVGTAAGREIVERAVKKSAVITEAVAKAAVTKAMAMPGREAATMAEVSAESRRGAAAES